jgi:hypothetical protein
MAEMGEPGKEALLEFLRTSSIPDLRAGASSSLCGATGGEAQSSLDDEALEAREVASDAWAASAIHRAQSAHRGEPPERPFSTTYQP